MKREGLSRIFRLPSSKLGSPESNVSSRAEGGVHFVRSQGTELGPCLLAGSEISLVE